MSVDPNDDDEEDEKKGGTTPPAGTEDTNDAGDLEITSYGLDEADALAATMQPTVWPVINNLCGLSQHCGVRYTIIFHVYPFTLQLFSINHHHISVIAGR